MRIKDWPLRPHAEAMLVAVGSPDAHGRGRQWRTHAHFAESGGETFDIRLPWGLFPKLRPGSVFVNGYLTGCAVPLETLDFKIDKEPEVIPWAKVIRGAGWMGAAALQNERCLSYQIEECRLIVPCTQVLRAFHAQTRLISHAVLRPAIIRELATGELKDGEARLTIARLVPQGVVTKTFARYLAKLVFEPAWLESFSDVFHRRLAAVEGAGFDKRDRIPLECFPPRSAWSQWRVVGQYLESGDFLVSDFLSTLSASKPPYRTLVILHNKKGPKIKAYGASLSVETAQDGSNGSRRSSSKEDPSNFSRPALIRQRAIEHGDSEPAQVVDVFPGRNRGNGRRGNGGEGGSGESPSADAALSVDEERRGGGQTSAEFMGLPGRDTTPLHFEIFINAFRKAIELREGWTLHFSIEALSGYLQSCQPQDRLVLFGRVKTPNTIGYLVELEPLQGQTSYTLTVIGRKDPEAATIRDIGSKLSVWLKASGRSHLAELLKEDPDYRVTLSTHRDLGATRWVRRILKKIDPPDRPPAWTRGVAG